MADKYPDFATLAQHERSGIDYRVLARRASPPYALLAPHGGGIEPGTSEIADAVAAATHSFHTLEGLKPSGNVDLHITSTHFDEPMCLTILGHSATVLTIHGEESEEDGEGVFVGGLDAALRAAVGTALAQAGFDVRTHPNPNLQGLQPTNVCNRGTSGAGVQLELSRAVRETMFEALTREGRKCPTAQFHTFVDALRSVLASPHR
jgi:phage replication-related protein YjqB (UPF0714/DUF867 family)